MYITYSPCRETAGSVLTPLPRNGGFCSFIVPRTTMIAMLVGPECPVAAVSETVLSCRRPSFAMSAVGSRYTSGSR